MKKKNFQHLVLDTMSFLVLKLLHSLTFAYKVYQTPRSRQIWSKKKDKQCGVHFTCLAMFSGITDVTS